MNIFLIILLGSISTVCGQSASLSAIMSKMTQPNPSVQQGINSDFQNSPNAKTGSKIEQNIIPRRAPQELIHQDVTNSVKLQEQVSQLSMTQLELSRRILSNILQLQTQLPKPLHTVMDTTLKKQQVIVNNPASSAKLLKNMDFLKANMEFFKPQQTNIGANTKNLKASSLDPSRLGLAVLQDIKTSQPSLPQQTIVLVDTEPNNFTINSPLSTDSETSTNKTKQPRLADTIQPILNAIRSRMASPVSAQVHSSHPQLGKETASTSFVEHLKKSPITSQIQSANPNRKSQLSQLEMTDRTNTISGSQSTLQSGIGSNHPSNVNVAQNIPLFHSHNTQAIGNQQSFLNTAKQSQSLNFPLLSIPKVNNSSLMFVTLPSQLANSNPLITSPQGNIPPPATVKKSNFNSFGTDSSSATVKPNPIGTNPPNNFGVLQNIPSGFGPSSTISNLNPHQSIGSIVTELQTLIAKLEFLQYDFKLAQLLQSNPALLSTSVPQTPIIKSSATNVMGSLKKSPSILPDHSTSIDSTQRSLPQTNLNNHQVNQLAFSQIQPLVQIIGAESQNHPVIQSIGSSSSNQPVIQKRIANTNQPMDQQSHIISPTNTSDQRKFNLQPYSYTYNVRDATTGNYQSKTEMMSLIGDVFGAYAFVDPAGTVSYTSTYNVSGATRLSEPTQQMTHQQKFLPPLL